MKRRRSSSISSDASGADGLQLQRPGPDDAGRDLLGSLARAAEHNKPEEIEKLAATDGLDLSAPWGDDGLTALHRATLAGSVGALQTLLDAGADPDAAEVAASGRTALHFAALTSDFASAKALLRAGADTELRDQDGRTPLHLSIIVPPSTRPLPSLPLYLLEVGAAGSTPDALGMTPLDIAVRHGRADVVRGIFRETGGAPVPCPANRGLLYEAVRGGDAGIVGALVEAGWEAGVPPFAGASVEEEKGTTRAGGRCEPAAPPGGSAAAFFPSSSEGGCCSGAGGSPALAATAAAPAGGGETLSPLMLAADSGHPSVVRAILRGAHRGFPNASDARGYTALHFATMRGSMSIAEALLGLAGEPGVDDQEEKGHGGGGRGDCVSRGDDGDGDGGACVGRTASAAAATAFADPDVANADGDTALHVAIATGRVEVAELLLRAGASVRVANRLGFTPLHFAAALGLSGLARRLLKQGAAVAAVDGAASASAAAAVSCGRSPRGGRRSWSRTSGVGIGVGGAGSVAGANADRERRSGERFRGADDVAGAKCGFAVGVGDDEVGKVAPTSQKLKLRTSRGLCPTSRSSPRLSPRSSARSSPKSSPRANPRSSPATTKRGRKWSRSPSGGGAKKGCRSSSTSGGGATKDRKKKEGRTPLHYAAVNGRVDTARVLLEAGAPRSHRWNEDRESPLFAAAKNGHAGVVGLLLEGMGPGGVDAPNSCGETPLSVACAKGHADVVDQLLRGGADVSRRDPATHQSVLDIAVSITRKESRARIVKAIVAAEAETSGVGGGSTEGGHSTSLRAACRAVGAGGVSPVKLLLEGGADANAAPPAGEGRRQLRPLHVAAVHGNVEAVSALTLQGCCLDVKTMDPSRSTPLVLAVQQGHTEAARVLIEAGAAIDVVPRGEDGSERAPSLARLAANMGRGDLVSLLAKALIDRDSSETWSAEWAAACAGGAAAVGGADGEEAPGDGK